MNSPDIQLFGRQAPIATVNQATIGLPRPLEPILQWAQRLGLAKILVAVLDASKTDRHLDYLGTIVEYLSDQETAKLIQTWSDELPCAADLSELCDACVISPFISRTYPPMPALKQVARQLTGGLLTKLATVAMVARPVPAAAAGDGWIASFRTWVFLQTINSVYQGGRPSVYLVDVTQKLRLAIDKDEKWLALFARLRCSAATANGMTRDLAAASERLLADRNDPVESSVHRLLLSALRNYCRGKTPESESDDDAEEHGVFLNFLNNWSERSSSPRSRTQDQWPKFDAQSESQETNEHGLALNFDAIGAEESVLEVATVEDDRTPPEQEHHAVGILLATSEEHQFLPFSWNRPSPAELPRLEQWLDSVIEDEEGLLQILGSFVEIAIQTAYSLDTVLSIPLSDQPQTDWSIDINRGCLHRLPPRRYNGWRPTVAAAQWTEPVATASSLKLRPSIVASLQRMRRDAPTSNQLGHLWPASAGVTPATKFNQTCLQTQGLQRLRSGMLAQVLKQRTFEGTGDPVLSQLLASHARTGLGGACAYSSYRYGQVQNLLDRTAADSTDHPEDSLESQSNAAGSELAPLDAALRPACELALSKVNELAKQPDQWVAHHNALTAYLVVVLFAATAARPVKSPFESPEYFDWVAGALYIEDKVSSQLHQGRLVPLPEFVISLMQDCYLPHLARLAVIVSQVDAPLSEVLIGLSKGKASEALPLFFLLGTGIGNQHHLRWFEVSETSLSALEVFLWPLPWNLMRHRLPSTLKRAGQDHESINGITGHGENGTAAYGPYSMRIWQSDSESLRQPLTHALLSLELLAPTKPTWAAAPILSQSEHGPVSCIQEPTRFGATARATQRTASHKKAVAQAETEILKFVGKRPIDSLSPSEWEALSQQMLLHDDGPPRVHGTIRYQSLLQWLKNNWQDCGIRPRIKRRYLPALEEKSPFKEIAIGCRERIARSLQHASQAANTASASRLSQREALALGTVLLVLESRIGAPAVIKDLLRGKNFRLVLFQKRYYLEHTPGLDKVQSAPVRRHEISSTAAVLLAKGKSSNYKLDLSEFPIPDGMCVIGQPFALDQKKSNRRFEAWILAIATQVQQANHLQYPGVVAAYLNGEIVSVGLHHVDWVRATRGKAVIPAQGGDESSTNVKGDGKKEQGADEFPETIGEGYLAWKEASSALSRKSSKLPSDIAAQQKNSFDFFQQIRDALNQELRSATPSRRDLDIKLRALLHAHKEQVSRSCLLLGEWQRSLLWRKTPKGFIRIRSLQRYLNALSVCFQAIAYDHDLLECDEEEVTDFYRRVLEIRQLVRPSSSEKPAPESLQPGKENEDDDEDAARNYRSQSLALQLLRDFHRLVSREFCVENPDWSELGVSDDLLSISPGLLTENDYRCALLSLAPTPSQASREDLARAFILLTTYRFGLRGGEATGMMRADWVDDLPDAIVLLVRGNRFRKLKTPAGQRQIPCLFELTEHEKQVVACWLNSFESITALNGVGPLFADRQSPDELMNSKQLRQQVGQVIKLVTGNSDLSLHHCRHSFANRVALLLILGTGNIWHHAAGPEQCTDDRKKHVRHLLLSTDQITRRVLWAIARLLGHAHPHTGVRSYLHLLPELANYYLKLSPPQSTPVSKHLSAVCINLDDLLIAANYLQPVAIKFEGPPQGDLNAERALNFLRLCQRGVTTGKAQQIMGISPENTGRLVNSVEQVDRILARRVTNRSLGGKFNLLSHIPEARWAVLIKRAHGVQWIGDQSEINALGPDDLSLIIGDSRQIVLWKLEHFEFFKRVVDGWKIGIESYRIYSTASGRAEMKQMTTQTALPFEDGTAAHFNGPHPKIDSIKLFNGAMQVSKRAGVFTETNPTSALRSSHELVLLVMVSLVLQTSSPP